ASGSGRAPRSGRGSTIAPTRGASSRVESTPEGSTQAPKNCPPTPPAGVGGGRGEPGPGEGAGHPAGEAQPGPGADRPRGRDGPIGARVSITAKSRSTTTAPT